VEFGCLQFLFSLFLATWYLADVCVS
jgi:hypothetical protein